MSGAPSPTLAVVIPTLNEATRLPFLLSDLEALSVPAEIVVADGGSTDGTRTGVERAGARLVTAPRGRASQLQAGAHASHAPWLLFLHADTRIGEHAVRALEVFLAHANGGDAAYFGISFEGDDWFWRFLEFGQRLRERMYGLVYGDQGLIVSRHAFNAVGGFPPWPLMEDVGLFDRLKRHGVRPRRLDARILTSPRRYETEGRWFGWLRNASLIALYRLGVSPERLARAYRPHAPAALRAPSTRTLTTMPPDPAHTAPRDTLIVFAKAPRPGRVKTRLAHDVGHKEAAEIYASLGRAVIDGVREGPYRIVVRFDPPGAEDEMRSWLGSDGLAFLPQHPGDLGARMSAALEHAFRDSERVCIVGTDVPDLNRGVVRKAFEALSQADICLGPALDGGYYLIALRRPHPALFTDIRWSTDTVLSATVERIRAAGLTHALLPALRDIDTIADLEARGHAARAHTTRA